MLGLWANCKEASAKPAMEQFIRSPGFLSALRKGEEIENDRIKREHLGANKEGTKCGAKSLIHLPRDQSGYLENRRGSLEGRATTDLLMPQHSSQKKTAQREKSSKTDPQWRSNRVRWIQRKNKPPPTDVGTWKTGGKAHKEEGSTIVGKNQTAQPGRYLSALVLPQRANEKKKGKIPRKVLKSFNLVRGGNTEGKGTKFLALKTHFAYRAKHPPAASSWGGGAGKNLVFKTPQILSVFDGGARA